MSDRQLRITLCTLKSFDPVNLTPTGARADGGQNPRMAIVALGLWMEKNGYPRETWDCYDIDMLLPSDEELERYFRTYKPNVIGLSAIVCSFYEEVQRVSAIARRACPDAWIVMGGHLSAVANVILNTTEVDICVAGDGEYPWIELLNYFKRNDRRWVWDELEAIKGLAYINQSKELVFNGFAPGIAGDELVQPDYDLLLKGLQNQPELLDNFFITDHFQNGEDERIQNHWSQKGARIISSKGCVAKCTFCQRATKGYRRATIDSIEQHLAMLKTRFSVGIIYFLEENFGSDIKQARQLADLMAKYDMLWVTGSLRVTTFGYDDFKYFSERGCIGVNFGLESGSQAMLDTIEKRITVDEIVAAYENASSLGLIFGQSNWLVGNPGDTEQSALETGRIMGKLAHILGIPLRISNGGPSYVIPIPGTPLYEYAQQTGVLPTDLEGETRFLKYLATVPNSFKWKYTNVNGAPRAEVMFWDILARMEASREYRRLCKEEPREITQAGKCFVSYYNKNSVENKPSFMTRLSVFQFVIDNPIIDSLPRWFIYPIVKWSNFLINELAKDIVSKLLGRHRERGFPGARRPGRLTIDPAAAPRTRGLRKIIEAASPPVVSRTEISQRLLTRGQ